MEKFEKGDRVECLYEGNWTGGIVEKVLSSGYRIKCGEQEVVCHVVDVREPQAAWIDVGLMTATEDVVATGELFQLSDIKKFYKDWAIGRYAEREQEAQQLNEKYLLAAQQGRIIGPKQKVTDTIRIGAAVPDWSGKPMAMDTVRIGTIPDITVRQYGTMNTIRDINQFCLERAAEAMAKDMAREIDDDIMKSILRKINNE